MIDPESRDLLARMRTALQEIDVSAQQIREAVATIAMQAERLREDMAALCALHERTETAAPEVAALLTTVDDLEYASDALDTVLVAGACADLDTLEAEIAADEEP